MVSVNGLRKGMDAEVEPPAVAVTATTNNQNRTSGHHDTDGKEISKQEGCGPIMSSGCTPGF
jgi:hypothetical protein